MICWVSFLMVPNLNDNSNCQRLIRPAALAFFRANSKETSMSTVNFIGMHKKVTKCQERHKVLCTLAWPRSTALCRGPAVLFFRVVNQQPGTSRPTSRLRSSSAVVWMWKASFSWCCLGLLARSITLVSSHLMGWWHVQACSTAVTCSATSYGNLWRSWHFVIFVHANEIDSTHTSFFTICPEEG